MIFQSSLLQLKSRRHFAVRAIISDGNVCTAVSPLFKVAGRYLIPREEVRAYLEYAKCQSETEERVYSGAEIGGCSRSSGSTVDKDAAVLRALAIADKLKKPLHNSLRTRSPKADVILLKD